MDTRNIINSNIIRNNLIGNTGVQRVLLVAPPSRTVQPITEFRATDRSQPHRCRQVIRP